VTGNVVVTGVARGIGHAGSDLSRSRGWRRVSPAWVDRLMTRATAT
jgi:hypothetical protein